MGALVAPILAAREAPESPASRRARHAATLAALRAGERRPDEEVDLRGARLLGEDLRELDLSYAVLEGADLSRADLRGAKLAFANLRGAILFDARLQGAELLSADLSGADLRHAKAAGAGFGNADLSKARLFEADFEGAVLSGAVLRDADLRVARLRCARLREVDLRGADLTGAILYEAHLEGAQVARATFRGADLRESQLRGISGFESADWIDTDIRHVDFCGAYLLRRHILDENYLEEFRRQSRRHEWIYRVWSCTSDCGRSFLRFALWTGLVGTLFALAYTFVPIDYGDHRTFLSPVYFSFVTLTTLGYGDVLPASPLAQALVLAEVGIGYLALGGVLSIFASQMARRAD